MKLTIRLKNKVMNLFKYILLFIFFTLIINKNFIYASIIPISHCYSNIAIDYDSGNVLYSKSGDQRIYPASTTKILTAILALENLSLNKKIIVSQNLLDMVPSESSIMGVKANEVFSVKDLLYGLMLPSGNDAALVLAEAVSGNVDSFVNLMNEKLQELGCYNTHFTNPHGFHDDNHYSTAYDMAKIFRYCLKNDDFKTIIGTYEYEITSTNITDKPRKLINTNKFLNESNSKTYYDVCMGGKTGYTSEAKNTLISYAVKDNKTIIVASFGGILNEKYVPYTYVDSREIFEYCFNNYHLDVIAKKDDYTFTIDDKLNLKLYNVSLSNDVNALTNPNDILYTTYNLDIDFNKISKSINKKNTSNTIGTITINYISIEKSYSNTYDLILNSTSSYSTFKNDFKLLIVKNFKMIISILVVFLAILLVVYTILKYKLSLKKDDILKL